MERSDRTKLHGLMMALADGNRAEFHPLFELLWPVVRSFTGGMLASEADAEDAAQETMLKVFSRARTFDRSRDAATWSLTIATYESLTVRRRNGRRRDSAVIATDLADDRPTAEDVLLLQETENAAAAAFGELREEDRDVILQSAQTSRGQRTTVGAAMRKRLQRALIRLRDAWGGRDGID